MWVKLVLVVTLAVIVHCEYKYQTLWFEVPLDHFGYQRNETFKIKYLVNDDHWDKEKGPIFFYTGNEGQIETFAQHTGFMWEIAEEFKAKLVFAEHRYYGASMPFSNKSLEPAHVGYLTAAQALADYAELVDYLQGTAVRPKYPVVAFGGSYGGMLAAYFRIKYPHLVAGAVAASAPVHMFKGMVPCEVFNRIVTSSFSRATPKCSDNVRRSWPIIKQYLSTTNGSEWLHTNWKLCSPINGTADGDTLRDFLTDMYTTLAMVNYPFASDFLLPLPAQPVRVVCQYLNETLNGQPLLEAVGKVLNTYANFKQTLPCIDYKNGNSYQNLDASGWNYQACTEMVMPICSNGIEDMFEPNPWNFTAYSAECYKKYEVYPNPDVARIEYGGDRLQAASNIVFSNGLFDPWAAGGILYSINQSVQAVGITQAAHHLDLMPSSPDDPDSVKQARQLHRHHITAWIREFNLKKMTH